MSNTIQIKRGSGKPDNKLAPYELGIDVDEGQLYYGGELKDDDANQGTKKYGEAQGVKVNSATRADNATFADRLSDGQSYYFNVSEIMQKIYPIGAIYISTIDTSPLALFGFGTWERIEGQFLLAAGTTPDTENTYKAGTSGGSNSHDHGLTKGYAEIIQSASDYILNNFKSVPEWRYGDEYASRYSVQDVSMNVDSKVTNPISTGTSLGGTTDSESNMPPYLAVYMWMRTA